MHLRSETVARGERPIDSGQMFGRARSVVLRDRHRRRPESGVEIERAYETSKPDRFIRGRDFPR